MSKVMASSEFVAKLKNIVENYKTLYVMGGIGDYLTASKKKYYTTDPEVDDYNKKAARVKMINAASTDTVAFDCVGLIKGILWGWDGSKKKSHGGAKWKSNGVPDIGADNMFKTCAEVSTDFTDVEVGEAVWTNGHIGVYIGNGLAIESTPAWKNKVQITACNCTKTGYNTRKWKKHGKLPYIEYAKTTDKAPAKKSIDAIAREVIDGKWYSGAARKSALTKAGYDYAAVQKRVNEILNSNKKSIDAIAKEVIQGKWGSGADRKNRLTKAGYDYAAVQKRVNELI